MEKMPGGPHTHIGTSGLYPTDISSTSQPKVELTLKQKIMNLFNKTEEKKQEQANASPVTAKFDKLMQALKEHVKSSSTPKPSAVSITQRAGTAFKNKFQGIKATAKEFIDTTLANRLPLGQKNATQLPILKDIAELKSQRENLNKQLDNFLGTLAERAFGSSDISKLYSDPFVGDKFSKYVKQFKENCTIASYNELIKSLKEISSEEKKANENDSLDSYAFLSTYDFSYAIDMTIDEEGKSLQDEIKAYEKNISTISNKIIEEFKSLDLKSMIKVLPSLEGDTLSSAYKIVFNKCKDQGNSADKELETFLNDATPAERHKFMCAIASEPSGIDNILENPITKKMLYIGAKNAYATENLEAYEALKDIRNEKSSNDKKDKFNNFISKYLSEDDLNISGKVKKLFTNTQGNEEDMNTALSKGEQELKQFINSNVASWNFNIKKEP